MRFKHLAVICSLAASVLSACNGTESNGPSGGIAQTGPLTIPRGSRTFQTDFLLFNGTAAWSPEVSSLKRIMDAHGSSYREVDEADLNQMSLEDLAQYGAVVWPGGIGASQVRNLTKETKINLRKAVQEGGVGWIGFCAGSFVAVAPAVPEGEVPSYGLGIVDAPLLEYYYREAYYERTGGLDSEMIMHTLSGGAKRDLIWYGGPVVPETASGVIARYENGNASISQTWSGNGFVILSAVHPAAPQSVKDSFGLSDSDGDDSDLAWQLLEGVLKQRELPKA